MLNAVVMSAQKSNRPSPSPGLIRDEDEKRHEEYDGSRLVHHSCHSLLFPKLGCSLRQN
jgi:hypothetical protein